MKLLVKKSLRFGPAELLEMDGRATVIEKLNMLGAVYIEGDVIEPNAREAAFLLEAFPENFEQVK